MFVTRCANLALLLATIVNFQAQAQAQNTGAVATPLPTQTSGGRNATPPAPITSLTVDGRITNVEAFLELDYSAKVLAGARDGSISPAIGRDSEVRRIEYGFDPLSGQGTVVVFGDPGSGRSTAINQFIINNPNDTVYRLRLDQLGKLKSKAEQSIALATVIDHVEALGRNNLAGKTILYIDNLGALNQGANVEVKPIGALLQKIADGRQLGLLLESDAGTYAEAIKANKTVSSRTTVVEVQPPVFDALVTYLRRMKSSFGILISDEALVKDAKISLHLAKTSAFDTARKILGFAANRARQEAASGINDVAEINGKMAVLDAEINSLKIDAPYRASPEASARLTELKIQRDGLMVDAQSAALVDTDANRELAELRRESDQLKLRLGLTQSNSAQAERSEPASWLSRILGTGSRTSASVPGAPPLLPADQADVERLERNARRRRELESQLPDDPANLKPNEPRPRFVSVDDINREAMMYLDVPKSALAMDFSEAIKDIPKIKDIVLNQDQLSDAAMRAMAAYMDRVRRGETEVDPSKPNKRIPPIWSVLIPGPTGTGKSEFAKQLANVLGAELLTLDMTNFQEAHSVSKLIGSPPGYKGYDEGGQLTEAVRRRPFQVILFDEIEKAHPDVMKVLMPLLDEGRLTDGQGRTVDFRNTIVIFTSNAGNGFSEYGRPEVIKFLKDKGTPLTDEQLESRSLADLRSEAVKSVLRAKFEDAPIARINSVISTNENSPETIAAVTRKLTESVGRDLFERDGIKLMVSETAFAQLQAEYRGKGGMRSLIDAFNTIVAGEVSFRRMNGEVKRGEILIIDFDKQWTYGTVTPEVLGEVSGQAPKAARARKLPNTALSAQVEEAVTGNHMEKPATVVTPEKGSVRLFNEEFLIRDATLKAMRRFRE